MSQPRCDTNSPYTKIVLFCAEMKHKLHPSLYLCLLHFFIINIFRHLPIGEMALGNQLQSTNNYSEQARFHALYLRHFARKICFLIITPIRRVIIQLWIAICGVSVHIMPLCAYWEIGISMNNSWTNSKWFYIALVLVEGICACWNSKLR